MLNDLISYLICYNGLAVKLTELVQKDPGYQFPYHRSCTQRYVSPKTLKAIKSKTSSIGDEVPGPSKGFRRSEIDMIAFNAPIFLFFFTFFVTCWTVILQCNPSYSPRLPAVGAL